MDFSENRCDMERFFHQKTVILVRDSPYHDLEERKLRSSVGIILFFRVAQNRQGLRDPSGPRVIVGHTKRRLYDL